jgi:uncharacterized protein YdhG (YjbR/CyaY superfamily)
MIRKEVKNIDEYIRGFPRKVQTILRKLRQTIKKGAPMATEGISYRIPTLYVGDRYLVYFAGFKNHVSIYPATTAAVTKVKGLAKYKVSKGTLRFPLDKPIPFGLLEKFVRYRVKERLAMK